METFLRKNFHVQANNFTFIARLLMKRTVLMIAGKPYHIGEIEFYLTQPEIHPDSYTHCHNEQKEYANWYFHRYPDNNQTGQKGSYKGGTWKGMDLTMGTSEYHCGILIRSLYTFGGNFIEGPCNSVRHILNSYGLDDNVISLTGGACLSALDNDLGLVLRDTDSINISIYWGPRIGLKYDKDPNYAYAKYRYAVSSVAKEKTKLELIPEGPKINIVHG